MTDKIRNRRHAADARIRIRLSLRFITNGVLNVLTCVNLVYRRCPINFVTMSFESFGHIRARTHFLHQITLQIFVTRYFESSRIGGKTIRNIRRNCNGNDYFLLGQTIH